MAGWLIPALKGLGSAVLGGLGSGIGKRIEAQVGGKKAAEYGASGIGATTLQAGTQYATTQDRSQGQSEAFNAASQSRAIDVQAERDAQAMSHDFYMQERRLAAEKEMLQLQMSFNGQGDAGERPWWSYPAQGVINPPWWMPPANQGSAPSALERLSQGQRWSK